MSLQMNTLQKYLNGMLSITAGALAISILYVIAANADSGSFKSSKHASPIIGVNRDSNLPRGNCSQCHLEHDGDAPNDFALFAPNNNNLCLASGCHDYEYQWPSGNYYWSYPGNVPTWYNSGHGASTSDFPPGSNREVRLCVQCHNPHSAGDSISGVNPSATSFLEEKGCYSNNGFSGQGCHGMNGSNRPFGAADIYSQLSKLSKHNVEATTKLHSSNWLLSYPYGRESRAPNSGFFSGSNRHVECLDCHNPHKAVQGSHSPATNEIGGALLGSWGVEPSNGFGWMTPNSFTQVDFTSTSQGKEYQLCFKCHSYFAFGNDIPNGYTDIAREFNSSNKSYHPIEDTIPSNSYTSPSANNDFKETMESPWDNNRHDKMTCSDCHASETSTDPPGPHGSNQPYILNGSPLATDLSFCTRCHKADVYASPFDPGSSETGSRFDSQTTGISAASHYFHVTLQHLGCRQCHGAEQTSPPASPQQQSPYPIQIGSLHGTNTFRGLLNGANINSYVPGNCTPTCHGPVTFIAGPE